MTENITDLGSIATSEGALIATSRRIELSEPVTIRNEDAGIQITGTKTVVAPGITAFSFDANLYEVPTDPMDDLQCDSCQ
jgi:hypothetical protein